MLKCLSDISVYLKCFRKAGRKNLRHTISVVQLSNCWATVCRKNNKSVQVPGLRLGGNIVWSIAQEDLKTVMVGGLVTFHPLLSIFIHSNISFHPLLSIFIHLHRLLSIFIHLHRLLSIFVQFYQFSFTFINFHPLLSIFCIITSQSYISKVFRRYLHSLESHQ